MSISLTDIFIFGFPLVVFTSLLISKIIHSYRLSHSGIKDIDKMSGAEFEKRLSILFRNLGYHVNYFGNRPGGDYGVDLVIQQNNQKTAIQAKCYQNKVGESAVREVIPGKTFYHCQHSMVVTNSVFTPMARKLGFANRVTLVDRQKLIDLLLQEKIKH